MAQIHALPPGEPDDGPGLAATVAAEVRAWRGRLNLSQSDLGRILGVTQTQISARLRGAMEFSFSEIETLAQAFGVSPAELMGFGPQTNNSPPPGIPRATGGGRQFVAPATGLEPVTCRLTAGKRSDLGLYPWRSDPQAA